MELLASQPAPSFFFFNTDLLCFSWTLTFSEQARRHPRRRRSQRREWIHRHPSRPQEDNRSSAAATGAVDGVSVLCPAAGSAG